MPKQAVSYEAVWGWGCFSREASFLSARQTKVKLPYEPRLGRQVSPDLAERRACPRTNATPRREPLRLTGVASKQLEAVWGCCCLYPTYTGPPRCRMLVGRWHGTRLKRQRRRRQGCRRRRRSHLGLRCGRGPRGLRPSTVSLQPTRSAAARSAWKCCLTSLKLWKYVVVVLQCSN